MHRVIRSGTVLRVVFALTAMTGGIVGLRAEATQHASPGVAVERTFLPAVTPPGYVDPGTQPYAAHVALVPSQAESVLYGVDELSPGFVSAYDLSSLRPLSRRGVVLDGTVSAFTLLPGRQGLLVAVSTGGRGQPTTELQQVVWSAGKLRVVSKMATPASALGPSQIIIGFAADPSQRQVFALSATNVETSYVPGSVQVMLVRLADKGRSPQLLWRQPLPDCQLPMATDTPSPLLLPAPLGLLHSRRALDVGCGAAGGAGIYKPPVPVGVGEVRLSGSKQLRYAGFELSPYPGDATQGSEGLWFPREDRLVFQTPNTENGGGWVVFDGDHNAYVGSIPLIQNATQAGADFVHGRVYLLTTVLHDGLRTADVGTTPVDQGHTYPQYYADHINEDGNYGNTPPRAPIATDPSHRRVFVLYTGSHLFVVLKDSVRYYSAPPPPDPDQNTTDVREHRDLTAANWSGSAQGYGSVIRQVGGASNLQNNLVPVVLNASQSGTQQLATSYLDTLQLTHGDARASAVTAEPDSGPTTGALAQGGLQWPYHPATCDDSGATKAADVDSAQVACDSSRGAVSAAVVGGAAGAGSAPKAADLVVSSTALSAKASAEFGHGITTTVTSVARGVSILGGQLQIGHIAATATVHAGGRPGTATSTYSRTLSNVAVAGQKLCARACDPKDLASQINEALAGRAVVSFPDPDRQLAHGSRGGYQSLIRRDAFSQIQETQLNDQDPGRAEVPAMQLTLFEDNTVKSRTVVYLAGVEAEAHYGIYRLSCATCPSDAAPAHQSPGPSAGSSKTPTDSTQPLSTTQTGEAPAPQVADPATGVVGALRHGWQLLTNGISEVIRLFGVWLLLLAPVYLSARRWLSLSRRSRP
jgi:hypothetical protein